MNVPTADRGAALAGFEQARTEFEEAVRRAPDAALRYRPAGEDYALGGLVVHVTDVLRRYGRTLEAIRAAHFAPLAAPDVVTSSEDETLIREGFAGEARAAVLESMRAAHAGLVGSLSTTDFDRTADVTYGGASQPYATSAGDILGWVRDHYDEHTKQIAGLVTAWADSTR